MTGDEFTKTLAVLRDNGYPELADKVGESIMTGSKDLVQDALTNLTGAVHTLYYSACWKSDRLTEYTEGNLWTAVRDAAGFEPGSSPKPINDQLEGTVVGYEWALDGHRITLNIPQRVFPNTLLVPHKRVRLHFRKGQ